MKGWNVISGGPSREYMTQGDLIPGAPVVTVNRAIDVIDKGITVDFAMFADSPIRIIPDLGLSKYLIPPLQIWCPKPYVFPDKGVMQLLDMVSLWEPYLPASIGIRTTPTGFLRGTDGLNRHMFGLMGALERCMMFRPERIRLISADMMGSWAPGLSEAECEMQQSLVEQTRRDLGRAQVRVNESRGKDKAAVQIRDQTQAMLRDILKNGDPILFKRWAHERHHIKELELRANGVGCVFEYWTPGHAVTA